MSVRGTHVFARLLYHIHNYLQTSLKWRLLKIVIYNLCSILENRMSIWHLIETGWFWFVFLAPSLNLFCSMEYFGIMVKPCGLLFLINVCICKNHFCKETPRAGNGSGRKTKAERWESRETHFLLCIECCNMLTKHTFKINNKVGRIQYRGTCSS